MLPSEAQLDPDFSGLRARLDTYLKQRQEAGAPTCADAPLFWSPRRGPYSLIGVQSGISLRSVPCARNLQVVTPGRAYMSSAALVL